MCMKVAKLCPSQPVTLVQSARALESNWWCGFPRGTLGKGDSACMPILSLLLSFDCCQVKACPFRSFNRAVSLTCASHDPLTCFSSFPTTPEFSDLRDLQGRSLSEPQSSLSAISGHCVAAIDIDDGSLYKSVWWGPVGARIMWSDIILGVSVRVFLDKVNTWMVELSITECPSWCGELMQSIKGLNRTKGWKRRCLCVIVFPLGHWSSLFGSGLGLELHSWLSRVSNLPTIDPGTFKPQWLCEPIPYNKSL